MIYLDCFVCGGYFGVEIVCAFPPDEEFLVVENSCKKLADCLNVYSPEFEDYVWRRYLDPSEDLDFFYDLPTGD